MMVIFDMESVQWWWYFFSGFLSPLNDDDHFWHAICSMMMILSFGGFEAPSMKMISFDMRPAQGRWAFFSGFWAPSMIMISFVMKSVQWWWYFFSGFEAPSMRMIIYDMQSAQWWWYLSFWVLKPLNEDDHFWHAVCSRKVNIFDMRSVQWWWYFFEQDCEKWICEHVGVWYKIWPGANFST